MPQVKRDRTSLGLLAAATVLLVVSFVRAANDEPSGAAFVFAVLFGVLGLKSLWRRSSGKSSTERSIDGEAADQ